MRTAVLPFMALPALLLGACATTSPGPVEVTRFVEPTMMQRLGTGTIFVEAAPATRPDRETGYGREPDGRGVPGLPGDPDAGPDTWQTGSLELAPYKAAVARELVALGYRETSRDQADQIAQVRLERGATQGLEQRGPVSVGVGGATGGYGSGLGLGLGFNLGGGDDGERISTRLSVMIRDKASGQALWEGRAAFVAPPKSRYAQPAEAAQAAADALFEQFPGNNGETTTVRLPE